MARSTLALACEQRAAAGGIANLHWRANRIEAGANEGEDARHFWWLKRERRHAGSRDAACDHAHEILVRRRSSELAASEVDAGDEIAVWSVALDALRAVETRT